MGEIRKIYHFKTRETFFHCLWKNIWQRISGKTDWSLRLWFSIARGRCYQQLRVLHVNRTGRRSMFKLFLRGVSKCFMSILFEIGYRASCRITAHVELGWNCCGSTLYSRMGKELATGTSGIPDLYCNYDPKTFRRKWPSESSSTISRGAGRHGRNSRDTGSRGKSRWKSISDRWHSFV